VRCASMLLAPIYASRAAFSHRVLAPRVHVFVEYLSSLKVLCYLCYANRVDREEGETRATAGMGAKL
jgi:hypothetical protein